jgi:hypothetical protein
MRRLALATAALTAVMVSTTGCGHFERKEVAYEYDLEVTGAAATSISVTSPRDDGSDPVTNEVPDTTLPFQSKAVAVVKKTGPLTLRVMPKDGDASCRIVVEGKEAAKKSGPAGTELVCTTTLKGVD